MELLVPPRRLGRLLAEARVSRGLSLGDVSQQLGGALDDLELLEVETGRRPLSDQELEALAGLYEIETSTIVPGRSRLTVDLDEGVIRARAGETDIDPSAHRSDVLAKYLALVYSMRAVPPGTEVALRIDDLDVLAEVFGAGRQELEDELHELMAGGSEPVRRRFRLLRGRLMVPVVGVVVAATTAGTLLLVPPRDSSAEVGSAGSGAGAARDATELVQEGPGVEIGDAVVQERGPGDVPGPVVIRQG
jgi:transcriptional regulator with XRE-family HTH domain